MLRNIEKTFQFVNRRMSVFFAEIGFYEYENRCILRNTTSSVLQKTADGNVKDGFLQCGRPCFTVS